MDGGPLKGAIMEEDQGRAQSGRRRIWKGPIREEDLGGGLDGRPLTVIWMVLRIWRM
jgi:hypothetical protein